MRTSSKGLCLQATPQAHRRGGKLRRGPGWKLRLQATFQAHRRLNTRRGGKLRRGPGWKLRLQATLQAHRRLNTRRGGKLHRGPGWKLHHSLQSHPLAVDMSQGLQVPITHMNQHRAGAHLRHPSWPRPVLWFLSQTLLGALRTRLTRSARLHPSGSGRGYLRGKWIKGSSTSSYCLDCPSLCL